jgi:tetratricopeptide (TPR) repeat protein
LGLAHRMGEPKVVAESLNWMGNWCLNQENPLAAVELHQEALGMFEQVRDRRGLATTLDLLGIASLLGGDVTACVGYYDRAIPLFREMDDQSNLASSLTGRGHASCSTHTLLTLAPSVIPISPRRDLEEALRIAREIGSAAGEAWVFWSVGLSNIVPGRYGQALEAAHRGLDIATQIGHREGMAASRRDLVAGRDRKRPGDRGAILVVAPARPSGAAVPRHGPPVRGREGIVDRSRTR